MLFKKRLSMFENKMTNYNRVSLFSCSRTDPESQCGKVIHKKSVGKAKNSKKSNFPLSPLIFYVLLSRIDFQSLSVNIIVTEPHCCNKTFLQYFNVRSYLMFIPKVRCIFVRRHFAAHLTNLYDAMMHQYFQEKPMV